MRSFYKGTVLEMLPIPSGVVAAIVSDITEDNKMIVEYRMISPETNEIQRIANNVYLLAKFGPGHKSAEIQVKNHLTCRSCVLSDGEIFIIEDDGSAKLLDSDGFAKWIGKVNYKNEIPCNVVYDGKSIWVAFSENNSLIRMNVKTMREELRIGGKSSEASGFSKPVGIFAEGNELYVSNSGSCSVWRINTKTYAAEEYLTFEEPVLSFCRTLGKELVLLPSGIYEV